MSIVKLNNKAVSNATAIGSISSLGSMTFIKKLTASSSATLSFVDGADGVVLDDTYKEYVFTYNNIHAATNAANFTFQANAVGASGYNETITSTSFATYHGEDGSSALGYKANGDQAQGTAFQGLTFSLGDVNDECASGYLHLFNPSSTTFVKHFIAVGTLNTASNEAENDFIAGYINTTSAIDEIQFKMSSGNIDAGDICLYGIA
jgi:expansin (peptidoglycan-binding protein)